MKKLIILCILLSLTIYTNEEIKALDAHEKILKKFNFKKIKKFYLKGYKNKTGTILVTPDKFKNVLPIGHAAIVKDKKYVYEATAQGVIRGNNNWHKIKKRHFGLRVKSLNDTKHLKSLSYIKKQLYKKYNFNFLNTKTRKKFYCSHLIWAAFYDNYNINLDTKMFGLAGNKKAAIHPLELVLSKKTKTVFYHENN